MLKSDTDTDKAEKLIKLMGDYEYLINLGAHSIQLDNCGLHYSHSTGSHSFYTRVLRDGPNGLCRPRARVHANQALPRAPGR